jgi:holliday junction DNA helicase RuvA
MIGFLKGRLQDISNSSIVLETCGGVGYVVHVSETTLKALGGVGSEISLLIITQVREDSISLYGFHERSERDVFNMLITIQGVGARIAFAMLSKMSSSEVLAALASEDKTSLTKADGVGPKLAARMIIELKDKAVASGAHLSSHKHIKTEDNEPTQIRDSRRALLGLGHKSEWVSNLIKEVMSRPDAPNGVAQIIRECLLLAEEKRNFV